MIDTIGQAEEIVEQYDRRIHIGKGQVDLLKMAQTLSQQDFRTYIESSRIVRVFDRRQS